MIQIGAPSATIDSPIEHLSACHRRIEQRLQTLVNAADHVQKDRNAALAAIAKSLEFLDSSGEMHTRDEEDSVFPRLRKRLSTEDLRYLDSLEHQHGDAESILGRLKVLIARLRQSDAPEGGLVDEYRSCAKELQALYAGHIRSEDEILTSLAKRNLTEADLAEVTREMRARRDSRRQA